MTLRSQSDKQNQYFDTTHLVADLKGRTVRGGGVTAVAQAGKFVLQTGSAVVLARLLTPEDYGLFGMAIVLINFIGLFKNLGLSAATVQKKHINHHQVNTLFWINVGLSVAFCLVVAMLSPAIAQFYGEPRLTAVTLFLSINFIFGGLTVQHQALMKRQMQFGDLAKIEIASMSIGLAAGVTAAIAGMGYWALIATQTAKAVVDLVGVWMMCRWRPQRPSRGAGVKSMLVFGSNVTGFKVANYFSRSSDNILIGRVWGAGELGLYAKAYQLLLFPLLQINFPLSNVIIPVLSSLQSDLKRYSAYYYKAVLLVSLFSMPLIAFLSVEGERIVILLLGKQWVEIVPIFLLLMPAAIAGVLNHSTVWIYQSLGTTNRQLRSGLVVSVIDVMLFLVSVRWGAVGIAAALGLSRPLVLVGSLLYCYTDTPLRFSTFLTKIAIPAIASATAAASVVVLNATVASREINILLGLMISGVTFFICYSLFWIIVPSGRKQLVELFQLIKHIKTRKFSAQN